MNEEKDLELEESYSEESSIQPELATAGHPRSMAGAFGMLFLELIKILILAGVTIGLVRYFLFKPFYVKGESMEPTYHSSEYLIIDEITYRIREPKRGEVVVFRSPVAQKDFYLKRIIGLPGERIKIENNKIIIYNEENPQGFVLDEKEYLVENTVGTFNTVVGPDQYYVMGDNRDASYDSRRFGPVDQDAIVGRTWIRGWPLNRFGIIDNSSLYKNEQISENN